MALFTEDSLRSRARKQAFRGTFYTYESKARSMLAESVTNQVNLSAQNKTFDIFLSHSSTDAEVVAGLKLELEDLGYSVYVDWIEDPLLSRTNVTKATALALKVRMNHCTALLYAFSENASNSKWMPWELGYFDGIKGTVAVLPIANTSKHSFQGSEYLGIYYYIQISEISGTNKTALWVYEKPDKYIIYSAWVTGGQPIQR